MALNEVFLEATVESRPQKGAAPPGHVEFVVRHESSQEYGRVDFFLVETGESLAELLEIRVGTAVVIRGHLTQRLAQRPVQPGGDLKSDVDSETRIVANRLEEIFAPPCPPPPESCEDWIPGPGEIPF